MKNLHFLGSYASIRHNLSKEVTKHGSFHYTIQNFDSKIDDSAKMA